MARPILMRLLDAPSEWTWLDPVAVTLKRVIDAALSQGRIADSLHGKEIGHPAHPPFAQAALGGWSGAGVLAAVELLRGDRSGDGAAARRTLGLSGLAGAVPTVVTGWSDWSDLHEDQQRTGLVHSSVMAAAATLSASARLVRRRRTSAGLDLGAALVATLGAALGGHLAYRWAAGANHAEAFPHLAKEGWSRVVRADELLDRTPRLATAGDEPIVVCRVDGEIYALADRCSHLSGPLHEGRVERVGGSSCLVCPWHHSAFDLTDGSVARGPAYAPQPSLEVRVAFGWVDVRPRQLPGVAGR